MLIYARCIVLKVFWGHDEARPCSMFTETSTAFSQTTGLTVQALGLLRERERARERAQERESEWERERERKRERARERVRERETERERERERAQERERERESERDTDREKLERYREKKIKDIQKKLCVGMSEMAEQDPVVRRFGKVHAESPCGHRLRHTEVTSWHWAIYRILQSVCWIPQHIKLINFIDFTIRKLGQDISKGYWLHHSCDFVLPLYSTYIIFSF